MHPALRLSGLSLLLLVAACKDAGDDSPTDDSTTPDDSAPPDYEEGCILVDGGGGYAYLADAYTVADEGSTITLCEGVMALDETFVISKPVLLEGPGPELLTWDAPVNQALIEVVDTSGVEIRGFAVTSTRNGIEVSGSADVTLADLSFTSIANTAIKLTDSTNVTVDGAVFIAPAYGGVEVNGGAATVSASDFQAPVAFAVRALGGGAATVTSSTIDSVTYTDATDGLIDGFALWATDGASLSTQDNLLTNNVIAVLTEEADLTMSGDQISGGLYGVLALLGGVDITGATITDPFYAALRVINQTEAIAVRDTTITGTPELVDTGTYNFDSYIGGAMTIATDDVATFENMTIQGYNSMGVIVLGYSGAPTVEFTDVNIESPGRYGLRMHGADATLTNVTVDSMRLVDDPDEVNLNGNYDTGFAVSLWECNTTWSGGGVLDSEMIGLINYQGALQVQDFQMANSVAFGLWNYYGNTVVDSGTFTGSSGDGGIANYYGGLVLQNSTFQDNLATYTYEYEYDNGTEVTTYGYVYTNQSADLLCYQATGCELYNNLFTDGSSGAQVSSSSNVVIEGNTWVNYARQPISLYSNTATAELVDNSFEDIGYYALYCYGSAVEAQGFTVDGIVGSETTVTYTTNGVETGGYTYTSSGTAMYLYNCTATLEELEISDATYHALYTYDSAVELYDASIQGGSESGSSGYGTVQAYWSATTPTFYASGVEIAGNASGYGLQLQGNGQGSASTIWLDDVEVTNPAGRGLALTTLGGATLTGISVTGAGSHGVSLEGAGEVDLGDTLVEGSAGYGLYVDGRWDYDGDGWSIEDGDCNDSNSSRYPGATESTNSVDDDCDGVADDGTATSDNDGDGYSVADGDCDDTTSGVYPGALEDTWGLDDDCDGVADGGAGATVNLSGLWAEGNSSGGAWLYRVEGTLGAAILANNSGYGLTCSSSADVESCDSADLSGNTSGTVSGCASCE